MSPSSTAQERFALAASQLGANDTGLAALAQAASDLQQKIENGIQHTVNTWVQSTKGAGFCIMKVKFDVAFTAEPIFSYGAAMVSISTRDYMPLGHGLVQQWYRGGKGNRDYVGANVALMVELRYVPGYYLQGFTEIAGSGQAVPVVAHHLTFTAPAGPPTGTPTNAEAPRETGLSK